VPYLHGNPWLLRHVPAAIAAIKVVHTIAWLSIEACLLYMLYTGIVRRSDRRAGIAAAVVACESLIFAANGFRCPLTDLAESLGATNGAVVDIYLPTRARLSSPSCACQRRQTRGNGERSLIHRSGSVLRGLKPSVNDAHGLVLLRVRSQWQVWTGVCGRIRPVWRRSRALTGPWGSRCDVDLPSRVSS
jgi:hypothetical protein